MLQLNSPNGKRYIIQIKKQNTKHLNFSMILVFLLLKMDEQICR